MDPSMNFRVAKQIFSLEKDYIKNNWGETIKLLDGFRYAGFDFNYRHPVKYECRSNGGSNWVLVISNYTLLHKAVGMSHLSLIRLLSRYGVDFNALTEEGYSPIMIGMSFMQQRVVDCLLDCKADVKLRCPRPIVNNYMPYYNHCGIPDIPLIISPLMLAIENGDIKMVKILLKYQPEVDAATVRHCLRVGQAAAAHLVMSSLSKDVSFKDDEISGIPSLQFYFNNYTWYCDEQLMEVIEEYKSRGYHVCQSKPTYPPVFQTILQNSFGRKDTTGFDFIKEMKDRNVNEIYLGQPALSLFFSRESRSGHHACCSNKIPCCRYYLQWFVRECADFQLYNVRNYVYHQGHLDVLDLLYEAGAVFRPDFLTCSSVCPQSCRMHTKYDADLKKVREQELSSFCEKLKNSGQVRSLLSLARIAVRKIDNIKEMVNNRNIVGSVYRDIITFRDECDKMEQKSFESDFVCCTRGRDSDNSE